MAETEAAEFEEETLAMFNAMASCLGGRQDSRVVYTALSMLITYVIDFIPILTAEEFFDVAKQNYYRSLKRKSN